MNRTPDDAAFSLCLTHDLDRPFKGLHQALFYALEGDVRYHLASTVSRRR